MPFLKQCLFHYFDFRVAAPSSPLFLEQIESCGGVVPENSELEVEVVLAEREYLKTLCQTVPAIPSKSLEPLISYLYHYSTFTDCFINLMAKNQRRLYSILLREIESELKSGNSERVLANADLYASMSETEFSELMKAAFPDDSCSG